MCQLVVQAWERNGRAFGANAGGSADWVGAIVRGAIIDNWETQDEPIHLKTIRDRIFKREQQSSQVLGIYGDVLRQGRLRVDGSSEQVDLRLSGLVVERQNQLYVYNRIYQSVFDLRWVDGAFAEIRPYAQQIADWVGAERRADELLLQGQELEAALEWAESRSLSKQDYQYLVESQKLGLRRELNQVSAALNQTNQQLAAKNQVLDRINQELEGANQELSRVRRRTKWTRVLSLGLVGFAVLGAGLATKEAWAQREVAEAAVKEEKTAKEQAGQSKNQAQQAQRETESALAETKNLGKQTNVLRGQKQTLATKNQTLAVTTNTLEQQNRQISQEVQQVKADQQLIQQQYETGRRQLETAKNELGGVQGYLTEARAQSKQFQTTVARQSRNLDDIFQISVAVSTFTQGNTEEALAQFKKILDENPDNSFALMARGEILLQSKQPDQALADFDRAIEIEPENPTAHFGRGNALAELEQPQFEDAIAAYDRCTQLKSDYYQAWNNRGIALVRLGRSMEAVESYRKSMEINPDYAVENLKETLNRLIQSVLGTSSVQSIRLSSGGI
ncbi:MAG: tetratricopeptide repeat protein, partial [Phormidesmis sp. CAN_BIN36]|nr:tetratricopeptide repeat protein [Phormidesmis sp. CAN_BIN36]